MDDLTVATELLADHADRYRLERGVGAGGMATVYLAEDLKHDRKVAIKVLRPELTAAVGAERFLREITTTAGLRHPHILPLFDSGQAGGVLYYVMPYVEGESLRDRLDREKQLPLDDALRIAHEVGDALSYAHSRGVIHRDIKPENILLESGHAVVADFGIARVVASAGGGRLTRTGLSIGTPSYMSPEQASGEGPIDGRSDLYSLACVLFEMLTGEPPFTGPSVVAVLARHALDPVPSLARTRPGVPPHVAEAVEKALAKAPADRFSTAEQWIRALSAGPRGARAPASAAARVATAPGPARAEGALARSIAVLPLANLSGDPEQEYFVAGMHDAIIAELARIRALTVISRTSVLRFKDTTEPISAIADQLGVAAVIEGSVLRAGDRVRITLQLIQASPEAHLWSESYQGDLTDVFALHGEVARAVAGAISATLTLEEEARLGTARAVDPEVYDLYLRGNHLNPFATDEGKKAIRYLRQVIARAPDFAPARSDLARRLVWFASLGVENPAVVLPEALTEAEEAHAMDPSSGDALAVTGYLKFAYDWDAAGARDMLAQALELEPGNVNALVDAAFYHGTLGEWEEADRLLARAMEADPLSPNAILIRGWAHMMAYRFEEALGFWEAGMEAHPTFAYLPMWASFGNVCLDRDREALALARRAERLDPESVNLDFTNILGWIYAQIGEEVDARRMIARLATLTRDPGTAWWRWTPQLALGETEEAYEPFTLAFEERNPLLPILALHPIFAEARAEPRFRKLIDGMGLPVRPPEGMTAVPAGRRVGL